MSAYLFLATTQPRPQHFKGQGRRRSSRDNATIRSGSSSRESHSSSSSYLAATTSHISVSSSDSESRKMVFDMNTSRYVTKSSKQKPVEKKIASFNSALRKLGKKCSHHNLNESMNNYLLEDKSDKLFTKDNLDMLRYTYFHDFTTELDDLHSKTHMKRSDGNYKLKYMRKLKKIQKLQVNTNVDSDNQSTLSSPTISSQTATSPTSQAVMTDDDDDSLCSDTRDKIQLPKATEEESLEKLYQQYTQFANYIEKKQESQGIREIIKSTQFWNDVYQDLKFESMQEKAVNYFDLLPFVDHTKEFFGELLDYFLYNLNLLECSSRGVSGSDIQKLSEYKFFNFSEKDYEFFGAMSATHYKSYSSQSSIHNSLNSPLSTSFSPIQAKFNLDKPSEEERIHNTLMEKLIETVLENLKGTLHGKRNTKEFQALFLVWSSLLKYLLNDLIARENYPAEEKYPEPTIEEQGEDESIFGPHSQDDSSAKPKNLKIKIMRAGSISSKHTNKSVLSTDNINDCIESFQSSQASDTSYNSMDKDYSHQNAEDTDATTAPSSPSFNSNKTSYTSKKATRSKKLSIFGKLRSK